MPDDDIAAKLERIEHVFDAISRAWSGSGYPSSTGGVPGIPGSSSVDTDTPFIRKLRAFAKTLSPAEQDQLRTLLLAAAAVGRQVASVPQTSEQQAASQFLQALDDRLVQGATEALDQTETEIGPTITITTSITVAASHPWITCD